MANGDFAQLFQTAVESEADEYMDARDALLELGEALLRERIAPKLDATDWREQMVAQILEGWLDDGALFDQVTVKVKGVPDSEEITTPINHTYSPRGRTEDLVAMGQQIVPRLLEMLMKSMEYQDTAELQTIVQTIEALEDHRAVLPLVDIASHRQLEPARVFALATLGALRDPRAFETVESAFANLQNSPGVRSAAAVALGMFADRRATPRLLATLRDPTEDGAVRRYAARGLGYLGDPAAGEVLAEMLRTEQPRPMALTLVHALSKLGGPTAIAALEETGRSHSDQSIRQAAEGARRMLA
jgi:HEAT repeat protein